VSGVNVENKPGILSNEYKIRVYLPGWIEEDTAKMYMRNRPLRAIDTRIPLVRAEQLDSSGCRDAVVPFWVT